MSSRAGGSQSFAGVRHWSVFGVYEGKAEEFEFRRQRADHCERTPMAVEMAVEDCRERAVYDGCVRP